MISWTLRHALQNPCRRSENAMSSLLSPPESPRREDSGDDGLDNLLGTFFKAQVPDPWPTMKAPVERRVYLATYARRVVVCSRGCAQIRPLATKSVALLVAGSWLLLRGSNQPTDDFSDRCSRSSRRLQGGDCHQRQGSPHAAKARRQDRRARLCRSRKICPLNIGYGPTLSPGT